MPREQRRLAAIVSADVAGYSRLMGRDEGGTLAALKAHRRDAIDPKIAECGGRIVKTTGDGLLLEFPSVVDAVRCAVDVQRGMAERNAAVAVGQRIDFRVGINLGDIIIDGDDIFGDGVNVAARLQALADPGGICVSRVVRDQVLDKLSFTFEALGPQKVKNISRPIEAYRVDLEGKPSARQQSAGSRRRALPARWAVIGAGVVTAAALGSMLLWRSSQHDVSQAPPTMSVGVVPLVAPTGDVAMEQRAETLTRDVISMFTRNALIIRATLGPTAKASTEGSKGIRAMASALNVRFLVEGQVRPGQDATVVSLRLMNGLTGEQVGSETVSLKSADTTTEPMWAAVSRLRDAMADAEVRRVMAQPRSEATAIDHVLLAWSLNLTDADTLQRARKKQRLLEESLQRDPNLVPALIELSYALEYELYDDTHADRARLLAHNDEVTTRAVNLNRAVPVTWLRRAWVLLYLGQADAALEANATAMRLDPNDVNPIVQRAWLMNNLGRPDEGLRFSEQALTLEPGNDKAIFNVCLAHLLLGEYEQAVPACERSRAQSINDRWVDINLMIAYAQNGDKAKAAAVRDELRRLAPDLTIASVKNGDSMIPDYLRLAEEHYYSGLRKAGIPEK